MNDDDDDNNAFDGTLIVTQLEFILMRPGRLLERARRMGSRLKALELWECGITSLDLVARVLEENRGITILELSRNRIRELDARFSAALQKHPSVSKVRLAGNEIVDLDNLALAVSTNEVITELELSQNEIVSTDSLALALKNNPRGTRIEHLRLSENRLESVDSLAPFLATNRTLLTLMIGGNRLRAVHAIFRALEENDHLERLALGDNQISGENIDDEISSSALFQMLAKNYTLTHLYGAEPLVRHREDLVERLKKMWRGRRRHRALRVAALILFQARDSPARLKASLVLDGVDHDPREAMRKRSMVLAGGSALKILTEMLQSVARY